MARMYGLSISAVQLSEAAKMEREADSSEVQAQYRGGCGTDSIGTEEVIPEEIPDSAYVLENGEERDFPENPKTVVPDNSIIKETPVEEVIEALSRNLDLYADKLEEEENLERLKKETGESEEMLRFDIKMIRKLSEEDFLRSWLKDGDTDLAEFLEGWKEAQGYEETAEPIGRGVNINAGHNVGAVIAPEIWRALSKNSVLHKMPSSDKTTLRILHEVYSEMDNPVANTCRVGYWPGGSEELEKNLFSTDYVMAWGDDATIDSIEGKTSPTTRFVPFHFEFGAYLVDEHTQKNYDQDLLERIAKDFSWGDQLLCFSPLIMIVEKTEDTEEFLQDLAEELENYKENYSMGQVPEKEEMNIIRSKKIARDYGNLISDWENDSTVVKHEGLDRSDIAEFHSFRYVKAHEVEDLSQALETVGSVRNLQEFILATSQERRNELRDEILHTRAKRIASPGGAPAMLPITWDGKQPVNQLLKWITDEKMQ